MATCPVRRCRRAVVAGVADRGAANECSYAACAIGIAPRWNGLAVVRGTSGSQVANLHFLWPRDVTGAFRGTSSVTPGVDSTFAQARRAVRRRRIGAALTDDGALSRAVW